MISMMRLTVLATLVLGLSISAQDIRQKELSEGLTNPARWPMYSGDYTGRRYSPLREIGPDNVKSLRPEWVFQTAVEGKFEATPIILDGMIFITGADNHAWAIDARTGREVWRHQERLPADLRACCGRVNRGFAAYANRLYMVALDAQLVALDRSTGNVMGGVEVADYKAGYTSTGAPLVVGNKVIAGIAGGIFGTRGFIDAYDVNSGKRVWRLWTVPEPGQPGIETWAGDSWKRGGGATWLTGTYDSEQNLLFWGTGNPSPALAGALREGDNLYTNCLLAIDPDTGKVKWHFQFTPHDTRDWDSVHIPVLADLTIEGKPRKTVMMANRNGFFYVLDRITGELLLAKPFVKKLTWAKGIGADGRPIVNPGSEPAEQGAQICPDMDGGTNWMSPSYSPDTGLFYVMAREDCATYFSWAAQNKLVEGRFFFGGDTTRRRGSGRGALRAIDPVTGEVRWEVEFPQPSMAGILSTASGLVFTGDMDGNVLAFDARTGKNLWHFAAGGPVYAAPASVAVSGKQFVLVPAGGSLFAFSLP